ncbi:hypothetical protein AV530_019876 [Patagioenas fasciata monilis]|uniref:Coiled-coil domain-containing protein 9 n=1 Tax=Patagioenas fasciata monilis TaxID=372326 RepID=A0A1V4KDP2_PATFA|nr:hypothetical protein AV530_019876 [Patagioenas fasciata monilis]
MSAALDLRSKEEKDAELDKRIEALRKKNEALIRRYQEIEEDRRKAEQEGVAVTTLRRARPPHPEFDGRRATRGVTVTVVSPPGDEAHEGGDTHEGGGGVIVPNGHLPPAPPGPERELGARLRRLGDAFQSSYEQQQRERRGGVFWGHLYRLVSQLLGAVYNLQAARELIN